MTDHVRVAERYARDVVSGKIVACKWIKLACARHLNDRSRKRWRYVFDAKKAGRACKFIELFPHTKGKWARDREPFTLSPWQCFFVCCLYGWVDRKTRKRRFRTVYLSVGRKNGKSDLAARIGLNMLADDGEHGAEVYSGATSEKQAWEVFRPARLMADKTPEFKEHYGIEVNARNINILQNGSRFEPVIGKPGDGASPNCGIVDEYHEHDTNELFDTMETGMGAREQGLMLVITTRGVNLAGPCYALDSDARQMLEGTRENDELFALIYTVDDGDDWADENVLIKANPNMGISVSEEFLQSRLRDALGSARKQGTFRTKHLNEWVGAKTAYFDIRKWQACANPELRIEQFAGQPCRIGLDLASKVDIAAMDILFALDGGRYARFGRYYLPEATVEAGVNEHYRGWANEGRLIVTEGNIIDFGRLRDDILELTSEFQVEEVAYDPHQATMLVTELMDEGVPCVEVRPTVLNFSEPMKTLDALMQAGKIEHDGDPVMTWMVGNVVAKEDAKDNVYPRKERPENKIDGVIANLSALARWLAGESVGMGYHDQVFVEL